MSPPPNNGDDPRWVNVYRYVLACMAMHDAAAHFERASMLIQAGDEDYTSAMAAVDAAVISYGRPFSTTRDGGPVPLPPDTTDEQRRLHDEIAAQRHKAVAHTDLDGLSVGLHYRDGRWVQSMTVFGDVPKNRHREMYYSAERQQIAAEHSSRFEAGYIGLVNDTMAQLLPTPEEGCSLLVGRPERATAINMVTTRG